MKALDAGLPPAPPQLQHRHHLPKLKSLRENAAEAAAEAGAYTRPLFSST